MIELIVVNIPKTGSFTVRNVLGSVGYHTVMPWNKPPIEMNPQIGTADSLWYTNRDKFIKQWQDKVTEEVIAKHHPDKTCLAGHIPIQLFDHIYPNAFRLTFMRDPVSWNLSAWFFSRWLGKVPNETSLESYLSNPINQNVQADMMGESIDNFDFVGTTEHLDSDFKYLAQRLGWTKEFDIPHMNHNSHPDYKKEVDNLQSDSEVVELIRKKNPKDCMLYTQALEGGSGWTKCL